MNKNFLSKSMLCLALISLCIACSDDDNSSSANDPTNTDTSSHVFNADLMTSANLLESVTLVSATLTDGTTADCYQLVFKSNPVADGPYCPETINDIGGVGVYDGATNPGFQVMKASLWDAMEADGYDIVDTNGNINIADPSQPMGTNPSNCLEASRDDNLRLTFLIPAVPKLATSDDTIGTVEHFGVSKDGVPMTGNPPSATAGPPGSQGSAGANIPAIDPCGGHMDPAGYYHLHFGAEEINNVFDAYGITEVSCTNYEQSETVFIGFAKDGFPIYASKDMDGSLPSDLDNCNGHTGVTAEYPEGIYHYHVSSTEAPNLPPCLKGVSANAAFTYE